MFIFVFLMILHFKTRHEQNDYYMNFQPLGLVKRTRARKTTGEVTKKTVRQRPKIVAETRTVVSGGAAGTQLVDELKAMG